MRHLGNIWRSSQQCWTLEGLLKECVYLLLLVGSVCFWSVLLQLVFNWWEYQDWAKRHPASKQQSQPYAMKQLGDGPKYAMTNISLPDAAGENLFKKELLMVMLVCPQWVYTYVRSQKLAISFLKGLYLSWDTAEAAIFLILMRNQITPGQANLEIEWGLSMNCLYSLCCEKHTYSVSLQKQPKMGVSKQNAQVWLPQLCAVIHHYLCWLEYQISSTHDAELCVTKIWSNNSQ